jgi:hypothetical protein
MTAPMLALALVAFVLAVWLVFQAARLTLLFVFAAFSITAICAAGMVWWVIRPRQARTQCAPH